MKDKYKMLAKAGKLFEEALQSKKQKRRDKKFAAAEKLSRKALALSREKIAEEASDNGYSALISSVYRLSALLIRQGRTAEAELLLAEVCSMDQYIAHRYGIACRAYYGSILCENGSYNAAGQVLAQMMSAVEKDSSQLSAMADTYALCMGYGNAAIAFTYSDAEGYENEKFYEPVEKLLKLREQGVDIGSENLKKAAYFAASASLYRTCYDAVSNTDAGGAANFAKSCIDECQKSDDKDFYWPAAMRIVALSSARDCQFGDCVKECKKTLEACSSYKVGMGQSRYGSVQNIAADMNLLLGIMHYRASLFEDCITYFRAAIAALEADAQGRPLKDVGYPELERIVMSMTSAEKAGFAHRYLGLAMFAMEGKYSLDQCAATIQEGAELMESNTDDKPYLGLIASSDYHIIAQMYEKKGADEAAKRFEALSKDRGCLALARLSMPSVYEKYMEQLQAHKRTALRLGLLELYGDYTRFEIILSEPPYVREEDSIGLSYLNFQMGEYCRVVGKHELAVDYYDAVREHTIDENGHFYYDVNKYDFWELSAVSKAGCLVRAERMPQACKAFQEFVDFEYTINHNSFSKKQLMSIANTARDIGLSPSECAEYLHTAAVAFDGGGEDNLVAAELFNQEGICWYNSSPDVDIPEGMETDMSDVTERMMALEEQFSERELAAFEDSYRKLQLCDPKAPQVIDLRPSLLSNIGECHVRVGEYDKGLTYYLDAVSAFEELFSCKEFSEKSKSEQSSYVMPYGVSFKTLGEIYDAKDDNEKAAGYFTKAIEVFEKIDSDTARHELAYCLNARGCIRYRLGDYRGEVEDITRALAIKKNDEGSEITMAIMLKNRSDAYRELGNYKGMHSDLTKSLNMLDQSGMPEEILNSFYGSHWFSMGVCQEGLHKVGKAADAYRKAAKYMSSSKRGARDDSNVFMQALCHFRRAVCLCRRDEQEFYGALFEYNNAIDLLEHLPASKEKNENLKQCLSSRANLYEVFREIDLAKADYSRAEMLGSTPEDAEA